MTLEELAEKYEKLQDESLALLEDLRAGNISLKQAKQRADVLNLTFDLLGLQSDILHRISAAQDDNLLGMRSRGGKARVTRG
jgi:hypothetical protein